MHLHIENSTPLGHIFEITESRLADAVARHQDIASTLKITVGKDGEGFEDNLGSTDILFAWNFNRENLATRAPNLKFIQIQGAGLNHLLPIDWVPDGITLTNSRGAHGRRASEYLLMGILAISNGLPAMMNNQSRCRWEQIHNSSIAGKTLLVFGVGHIGGDTAEAAKFFGLNVIGVRRSGESHPHVDEMFKPEDLHQILPSADFIIVTAPHTKSTEKLFGEKEFALMKDEAGFINYSRSSLADYEALCPHLESGRLSAVLDVFDQEPLPETSPLWSIPNLIITPHSASNDPVHHASRSLDILFENIKRYKAGKRLNNIVDPAQQY